MAAALTVTASSVYASAAMSYTVESQMDNYILCRNDDNGYYCIIDDSADLITDSQFMELIPYMLDCTDNGNALFVTIDHNNLGSAQRYADAYYDKMLKGTNGLLFLIDMDTRKIYISSSGAYRRIITNQKADIITDNVYRKASAGDYIGCAKEAFKEVSDLIAGNAIAQPMKYASNACLAVLIALFINYFIARGVSKTWAPSEEDIAEHVFSSFNFTNPTVRHTNTTRTYSPRSSGSGGGGGGGGGGHSGGGHSF